MRGEKHQEDGGYHSSSAGWPGPVSLQRLTGKQELGASRPSGALRDASGISLVLGLLPEPLPSATGQLINDPGALSLANATFCRKKKKVYKWTSVLFKSQLHSIVERTTIYC